MTDILKDYPTPWHLESTNSGHLDIHDAKGKWVLLTDEVQCDEALFLIVAAVNEKAERNKPLQEWLDNDAAFRAALITLLRNLIAECEKSLSKANERDAIAIQMSQAEYEDELAELQREERRDSLEVDNAALRADVKAAREMLGPLGCSRHTLNDQGSIITVCAHCGVIMSLIGDKSGFRHMNTCPYSILLMRLERWA
jgi:hypothetical protein